jgi:hypothetical protein
MYMGQTNTYPTFPAFLKYLPSIKIRELDLYVSFAAGALHEERYSDPHLTVPS